MQPLRSFSSGSRHGASLTRGSESGCGTSGPPRSVSGTARLSCLTGKLAGNTVHTEQCSALDKWVTIRRSECYCKALTCFTGSLQRNWVRGVPSRKRFRGIGGMTDFRLADHCLPSMLRDVLWRVYGDSLLCALVCHIKRLQLLPALCTCVHAGMR